MKSVLCQEGPDATCEFTPEASGKIGFHCWDEMIFSVPDAVIPYPIQMQIIKMVRFHLCHFDS